MPLDETEAEGVFETLAELLAHVEYVTEDEGLELYVVEDEGRGELLTDDEPVCDSLEDADNV